MISEYNVRRFVKEGEMEKIENYDKAVADKSQTWHCHHRLELTLDGEFAHSMAELKRLGMYYKRPYFELIFLTKTEHRKLHGKAKSEETKKKLIGTNTGKKHKVHKETTYSEFGKKYSEHYGYGNRKNTKQYLKEYLWYYRHNNKCRWEQ